MRVFLTGGSGFIGGRLLAALRADGHEVACLCRSQHSTARVKEQGAEAVTGDLADPASLRSALESARPTHVAHLAAEIATQKDEKRIELVNVTGTRTLVEACRGLPIERFLFLSTVVRGMAHGELFTEESTIPATTAYGRSKGIGDTILMEAHREWGLPAVVLRPSHVYGAGGWFEEVLNDRKFRIPGTGENWWDMVHVDDVVSACVLLLQRGEAGQAYHVVDDEPVTMKQFWRYVSDAQGRKPYGHVPVWLAKLVAGSGPIVAAVRSARSSARRLKALGWTPRYPRVADGVPAVVAEIQGRGA